MKKVENWIEKKGLINTSKRFKFRHYLNKSVLKKKRFFFFKIRSRKYCANLNTTKVNLKYFFIKNLSNSFIKTIDFGKITLNQKFLKTLITFI